MNFPFGDAGLYQEALEHCEKGIKIGEKIGDYNLTAILFMHSGFNFEGMGDSKAAVAQTLKGVEDAEKAEAYYALSLDYANLVRYYAMLGEVEHAEEFCSKLDKLMDEAVANKSNRLASGAARISKAFLCSVKGQWKEVNEYQERVLDGAFGGTVPIS